jgi:hypothetical protein
MPSHNPTHSAHPGLRIPIARIFSLLSFALPYVKEDEKGGRQCEYGDDNHHFTEAKSISLGQRS